MSEINVRMAEAEDCGLLAGYIRALAALEKQIELAKDELETPSDVPDDLEERLRRDGPGGKGHFQSLIVEVDGNPVGMAMFSIAYDAVIGAPCVFLRHIYVAEGMRRNRLGTCLMVALSRLARDQGWPRIDWHVRRLDLDARVFFDKICSDSFNLHRLSYRIDGGLLDQMAELPL
ncbi:GNAT family N-acetyltransferase [Aestuariispira insulae]|uniref:Acetyltransferase (GNAT) family protein n=1 Tax=Aestuariispira insulae TaxID=1461337 RepID=A0A3D9HSF7_9PROT|nr:GNAT family N-acetyltransferase [Aestuariispira insulae]RED52389.1 acetyltransferase (GNAT) family protein [Aestuariispira insulae]